MTFLFLQKKLLIFVLIVSVLFHQYFLYQPHKVLTLEDYKGTSDIKSPYSALTICSVFYNISNPFPCSTKGKGMVRLQKVTTGIQLKQESWIKVPKVADAKLIQELLSHEQGHYDIFEIYRLDLEKTIKKMCFKSVNLKFQLDSLNRRFFLHYDSIQNRYDQETNHMQNKEEQIKWKQKINSIYYKIFDKN